MGQFCRHCGNALDADARFCRQCGRPADDAAVAAAVVPVPVRAGSGRRGPMLLGCLLLVVVVVVGVCGFGRQPFQSLLAGTTGASPSGSAAGGASSAAPSGSAAARVPCSASAQQQPSTAAVSSAAPKARVRLIAGPIDPKDANGNSVSWSAFPETSTRAFSISGLKAKTSETVNLLFDAPTVADFPPSGVDFEICDASGMTKHAHAAKGWTSSPGAAGVRISMLGDDIPDAPGTGYRIDAYVWLPSANAWYFVARMTGVSFVP